MGKVLWEEDTILWYAWCPDATPRKNEVLQINRSKADMKRGVCQVLPSCGICAKTPNMLCINWFAGLLNAAQSSIYAAVVIADNATVAPAVATSPAAGKRKRPTCDTAKHPMAERTSKTYRKPIESDKAREFLAAMKKPLWIKVQTHVW